MSTSPVAHKVSSRCSFKTKVPNRRSMTITTKGSSTPIGASWLFLKGNTPTWKWMRLLPVWLNTWTRRRPKKVGRTKGQTQLRRRLLLLLLPLLMLPKQALPRAQLARLLMLPYLTIQQKQLFSQILHPRECTTSFFCEHCMPSFVIASHCH